MKLWARTGWVLLGAVVALLAADNYRLRELNRSLSEDLESSFRSTDLVTALAGSRKKTISSCREALSICQSALDAHVSDVRDAIHWSTKN